MSAALERPLARWAGRALVAALLAFAGLQVLWVVRNREALRPIAAGERAQPFELPLARGGRFRLSSPPGRVTLIDFWASWCAPCRAELPALERLWLRNREKVDLVAVNVEEAAVEGDVRTFITGSGLGLPFALGGSTVAAHYRVESLPHVVVVDASGSIREVLIGPRSEAELQEVIDAAGR